MNLTIRSLVFAFSLFTLSGVETLEPAEVGGTVPLHKVGNLYLAGQPSAEALGEFARLGTRLVIDLRRPGENTAFDEPAVVRELGMEYVNIPIGGPDDMTDEVFGEIRERLGADKEGDVLLHCASSNRVGAVWLAARTMDEGVVWDKALGEAKRAGLRSPALLERTTEYTAGPSPERWRAMKKKIREEFPAAPRMSVMQLRERMLQDRPAPILIDARAEGEYAVSRIEGAVRAESLEAVQRALGDADAGSEIVVYCSVGYRSAKLTEALREGGYSKAANLEGSIFEWANRGYPLVRDGEEVREVHPYNAKWGELLLPRLHARLEN